MLGKRDRETYEDDHTNEVHNSLMEMRHQHRQTKLASVTDPVLLQLNGVCLLLTSVHDSGPQTDYFFGHALTKGRDESEVVRFLISENTMRPSYNNHHFSVHQLWVNTPIPGSLLLNIYNHYAIYCGILWRTRRAFGLLGGVENNEFETHISQFMDNMMKCYHDDSKKSTYLILIRTKYSGFYRVVRGRYFPKLIHGYESTNIIAFTKMGNIKYESRMYSFVTSLGDEKYLRKINRHIDSFKVHPNIGQDQVATSFYDHFV